jgi:hypothetical protein
MESAKKENKKKDLSACFSPPVSIEMERLS